MARRYILRYDIWICLLLGFLVSLSTERLASSIFSAQYEQHKSEHIMADGIIGGKATDTTFRAQNIADLLSHDTFTVISEGISWRNDGGGFYDNFYMQLLELPSGERVAARINNDAVQTTGDSIYSGDSILPVGKIITADLTQNENFLQQIEHGHSLDRKDFYIDMVGDAAIASEETAIEAPTLLVQLATVVVIFALTHFIGSKIGFFPAFYTRKKSEEKPKSDWD